MAASPLSIAELEQRLAAAKAEQDQLNAGFTDFFFNDTATTEIYTLSLHDALPI